MYMGSDDVLRWRRDERFWAIIIIEAPYRPQRQVKLHAPNRRCPAGSQRRALTAHQNLSSRAGPVGKWARFSPMDWVNRPNSDWPPKPDTAILEGMVQLRSQGNYTARLFRSHCDEVYNNNARMNKIMGFITVANFRPRYRDRPSQEAASKGPAQSYPANPRTGTRGSVLTQSRGKLLLLQKHR